MVEFSNATRGLYLKTQVQALRAIYTAQQRKLRQIVAGVDSTDFQKFRAEALLKQIDEIVASLNVQTVKWADKALPQSYRQGIDIAAERLKALNVTRFVSYDANIHTAAIAALIDEVSVDLIGANTSIARFFNHYIRKTQQQLLQDREISLRIAEGFAGGETRRTVSDAILGDLRQKMQDEKFIVINGRNFQPDYYAELVARTRTREATTQGTINTSLRYGLDLVSWDVHEAACEYCQQFEGRVFSISGNDPDFPALTIKPPVHPHCECNLSPTNRATLERRGYLDEIIKLSNNSKIEIPSFSKFQEVLAHL